jgi:aspartate 1-decarboxylase
MTFFVIAHIAAHLTQVQFRFQFQQGIGQMCHLHLRSLQQIHHQAQGRSLSNSWKRRQRFNSLFHNARCKLHKSRNYIKIILPLHCMFIEVLQAKIHNVRLTQTELNYTGSITIDENLIDAAGMIANQKVLIVNNNNGERFETYIIKGERGTGIIGLNGAAARKGQVGDELIIMTFVQMTPEEAKIHQPNNLFPDRNNQVI